MTAIKALFRDNFHPEQDYDLRTYTLEEKPLSKDPLLGKSSRPRYKIDLASQQAECEANYHRLLKLLPKIYQADQLCDQWVFEIGVGPISGEVHIEVMERAPYTTTIKIVQQEASNVWAKAPVLTICLYHDVCMAEVVAWQNHRRLRARYEYPNPDMYHSDEKAQLNQFLREWLTLCQSHGRTAIKLSDLGVG